MQGEEGGCVPAKDTVQVLGHGRQTGSKPAGRHGAYTVDTLPCVRLTFIASAKDVDGAVDAIRQSAATGAQGDGAVYVCPAERIMRISTGEVDGDVLAYEGDIDIQGIISPPPELSDLLSYCLERKYRIEQ